MLLKNGIYFDPKVLLDTIKTITLSDFEIFEKNWLSRIYLEWFINGNMSECEALNLFNESENYLKSRNNRILPKTEINEVGACNLGEARQYIYDLKISDFSKKEEKNSAIKIFWQGNNQTPKEKIIFQIIDKILFDPCFDKLRTDQQLGYVVSRFFFKKKFIIKFFK